MDYTELARTLTPCELTNRQIQVIRLKAKGAAIKEIAYKLDISARTVEEHIYEVIRRLEAKNSTHAVALAIAQGHIEFETIGMTPEQVSDYLNAQTEKFQLHVLKDLVARQVIGHNDYEQFSRDDWDNFNNRFSVVVADTKKRVNGG